METQQSVEQAETELSSQELSVQSNTDKMPNTNKSGAGKQAFLKIPVMILAGVAIVLLLLYISVKLPNIVSVQEKEPEYTGLIDDLGRPLMKTYRNGAEHTCVLPDAIFYGDISVRDIYYDVRRAWNLTPGIDIQAEFFINGLSHEDNENITGSVSLSQDNEKTLTEIGNDAQQEYASKRIGNGTVIEVFYNKAEKAVRICAMSRYAGKISSFRGATAFTNESIVLSFANNSQDPFPKIPEPINGEYYHKYEVQDMDDWLHWEEGDVVAYTFSEKTGRIQSVVSLEAIEGVLIRRVPDKSLVLDGDVFQYALGIIFNVDNGQDSLWPGYEYIVYIDEDDYILWVEEADFVDNYALIMGITCIQDGIVYTDANPYGEPGQEQDNQVHLWLSNGAWRTVLVDKPCLIPSDASEAIYGYQLDSDYSAGSIIRYTTNDNGEYTLRKVKSTYQYRSAENGENGGFSISYCQVSADGKMILADEETRFIIHDKATSSCRFYQGIHNVPDLSGEDAYAYIDHGLARFIFVINASIYPFFRNIVFISGKSASGPVIDSGGVSYYEYTAVEMSEIKTILVKEGSSITSVFDGKEHTMITDGSDGFDKEDNTVILNTLRYDADDCLIEGKYVPNGITAHKTRGVKNSHSLFDDEIQLGTEAIDDYPLMTFAVSSDARIYYVCDDGEIEQIDQSEIVSDWDDWVYYILDHGEISYLFISEAETVN